MIYRFRGRAIRGVIALLTIAALQFSTSGCAIFYQKNRPVFNAFEQPVVPTNENLVIATFPITFPLGVLALVVDQFVVRPVTIFDDASGDMFELFWEDVPWDEEYVEQCYWAPWRTLGAVILFPFDYGFRLFFDVSSASKESWEIDTDDAATTEDFRLSSEVVTELKGNLAEARAKGNASVHDSNLAHLWGLDPEAGLAESRELFGPDGDPILQASFLEWASSLGPENTMTFVRAVAPAAKDGDAAVRAAFLRSLMGISYEAEKDDIEWMLGVAKPLAEGDPSPSVRNQAQGVVNLCRQKLR